MALPATIYKGQLQISDMARHVYGTFPIVAARHPSETEERLLVRLIAFMLEADERLEFGRGLSSDGEAALCIPKDGGGFALWTEVGVPDEKVLKKALSKSDRVQVYLYGQRRLDPWKNSVWPKFRDSEKVEVFEIEDETLESLKKMLSRKIDWTVLVPEKEEVSLSDENETFDFKIKRLS